MTTAKAIPPAADKDQAPQGPLSDDALRLITAELYRASAEAIAAFDPDDTLAARLEPEWYEVDWSDEEETEEEPGWLSKDRIKPPRAPRRHHRVHRSDEIFALLWSGPERWDPSPPPH